jgi:transcriptional regulator with XRE-family HTH domain
MSVIENWNPERLKEAMIIRGLSNQDVAKELDVGWVLVHKWQNKRSGKRPTLEQLWEISKITQFPYQHFVTHDNFKYENMGIFF